MKLSPRTCNDCGVEIPANERRYRCPECSQLVCGWCMNHVHNQAGEELEKQKEGK